MNTLIKLSNHLAVKNVFKRFDSLVSGEITSSDDCRRPPSLSSSRSGCGDSDASEMNDGACCCSSRCGELKCRQLAHQPPCVLIRILMSQCACVDCGSISSKRPSQWDLCA